MDITTVYNELSLLVQHIPKHKVLIIGGEINQQIDKNENNKFFLHNSSNRKREYPVDFSLKLQATFPKY